MDAAAKAATALRICLVTPFSWSQPHEVNEHVAGVAAALRARGHTVTVLAPSSRARELLAGRRALARRDLLDVVAVGPAVPFAFTGRLAVPVASRANLALALAIGRFDVVHGIEPALPSLSYLAMLDAETMTAATFFSADAAYPPRKNQRARLLARVDALIATSDTIAEGAARRFPGDYTVISTGVDVDRFAPRRKRHLIAVEAGQQNTATARAVLRTARGIRAWEVAVVRASATAARPFVPLALRDRARIRTVEKPEPRATVLGEAAIFVPAIDGSARLRLEAEASGCAIADPPGVAAQPELAGAAVARLTDSAELRSRLGAAARTAAQAQGFDRIAQALEHVYGSIERRKRAHRRPAETDPLAGRDWILADLHMHTSWSHDCSIEPQTLVDHAIAEGLGCIAVTDHNVLGGALEAAELARDRGLIVIPGEEMKTDGQGEVIGLFLREEIPRGMSFADTLAAIRAQEGITYVPHPFDRMHAIPTPATLHRHLPEIDVLEVYNARLLFGAYNDEALRFQQKYGLLAGAGSDAHVLQGVGTGALRMRRFDGPEEFLLSLRTAEVLRRPKSLAYLQSLKWVAQVKEKVR